ncbi:sensor histidine kinase [Gemmatimonas groenlandica]|uniref:histidine kinase n=1 Tax=Gemmatimonas groenlandica TaxID=2732249 RepID=A0A6M4IMN8_9BACT|nr:ATP-binding protein [Gemmatimonas groenlandica]QJR35953.1 PAS domain S-box protein [Gemmatimonas groenlandica]
MPRSSLVPLLAAAAVSPPLDPAVAGDANNAEALSADEPFTRRGGALERAHSRLHRQRAALAALARSSRLESGDLALAGAEITETAARTLSVARASVWMSADERDGIRCADLFDALTGVHSHGMVLPRAGLSKYFTAMETERIVAAHCAQADPRTAEFADSYLIPLGITSMLDAPVWANGVLTGVVCLEHIGGPREWTDDEQSFAGSVADLLSRALAARERVQAKAALLRSEERFRSMIERAADVVTILSGDGTISYESPSVARVLGYAHQQLVGASLFDYVHPDDRTSVKRALEQVMSVPNMGVTIEFRFRHADGSWRVLESLGTNLVNNPAINGIIANSRDVTDRRAVEAELERQRRELARSNQELEQFAYVASHDLQEPLRKIQAFGDRLLEDYDAALAGPGQHYLSRMRDAARRMQDLISDLLSFSRVATKPNPLRPVDLNEIAEDVRRDLDVLMQQPGARLSLDLPVVMLADQMQCRQLLQNLIGNALKFHREGIPPMVDVRARLEDGTDTRGLPTGRWCRIAVEDNGIGFDEKFLDRIFNPFQRLHGRGVFDGTGMGLAICRKIVERHGGNITATSTVGVGTTFIVRLPVHDSGQGATA